MSVRSHLTQLILKGFTENERKFLLSLKAGLPDWSLVSIQGIEKLPAILWKLENIKKIPDINRKKLIEKLKIILKL